MTAARTTDRFIVAAPLLFLYACVVAALYGALHDQISYTAAPEYFTKFKFLQFQISEDWPPRLGAAWVGVQATWWMGAIIGLLFFVTRPFFVTTRAFAQSYLRSALIVVGVALAFGLCALAYGYLFFDTADVPRLVTNWRPVLSGPLAFWRVGHMHNFSYVGGGAGALAGLSYMIWRGNKEERPHRKHHRGRR